MKKFIILATLLVVCTSVFAADSEPRRVYVDGIEVVVNENKITYSEINLELQRLRLTSSSSMDGSNVKLLDRVVHNLIVEHLLVELADQEGIIINDKKLRDYVKRQVQEYGGERELIRRYFPLKSISDRELTLDDVKEYLARMEKVRAILQLKTKVSPVFATPKKIKKFYDAHKGKWMLPATVKFRTIQIDYLLKGNSYVPPNYREFAGPMSARDYAKKLLDRINDGEDFATLAKSESNGQSYKDGGLHKTANDEEWFKKEDLIEPLAEFLFDENRKPGDVSQIIEGPKSPNGEVSYFVLKLEESRPERVLSYKEAQIFIRDNMIRKEENRRKRALIEDLYKKAYIFPKEYQTPWTES